MTRISFYILRGTSEHDREHFACRLAEKAYKQNNHVYICAQHAEQAKQIDTALWSFRSDSFVPHQLVDDKASHDAPVLIGHLHAKPPRLMDLLINFSYESPDFFSQFNILAELVNDDNKIKEKGRNRYRFYKQHGYVLNTFNV